MLQAAPAPPAQTDETLARARAGDSLAFADIVRQHQAMVFSLARHFTRDQSAAEDLAQDVFLDLYKRMAMSFDDELRRVLRREKPPPGFAERTLARISQGSLRTGVPQPASRAGNRRSVRWLAVGAAASLVIVAGASRFFVRWRAAQEGERAKRQVELALRVTSETLNEVRAKVAAISRNEF
jgi:hypothetical protein